MEYVANLPKTGTDALKHILYDDACHLKKFCEDPVRSDVNEYTKLIAEIPKNVDNFHFKNLTDSW